MYRALRVPLLLIVILCATPSSAHAWWFEWLEEYSGPGPFTGQHFGFRVVCFGDNSGLSAIRAAGGAISASTIGGERGQEAAFAELRRALEGTNAVLPGIVDVTSKDAPAQAKKASEALQIRSGFDVDVSACPDTKVRRSSIDVEMAILKAKGSGNFAVSKEIRLTTVVPRYSIAVIRDPAKDFLDIGFGAGIYWFTSEGFAAFNGLILEPFSVAIHAPTRWSSTQTSVLKRVAAAANFRWTIVVSPAGFGADAFLGVGEHDVRIPSEFRNAVTAGINVGPLLNWLVARQ